MRRPFLLVFVALALICSAFFFSKLVAAEGDKEPAPESSASASLRDMQATLRARRAINADETLVAHNLSVKVCDGVATVWGSVPADDLIQRVLKKLEQVRGVYEVRSELRVTAKREEEPILPLHDPPMQTESASPDPETGRINALTGRQPEEPPALVMPAISLPRPASNEKPAASPVPTPSAESLSAAIERVRQGDARFRPIQAELRDGVVTLRSGAAKGEHVTAFAQALSRLPGVERVVVQSGPR
jgi:osmotically-inducible protein OsmY